jgi:hypothetical protein
MSDSRGDAMPAIIMNVHTRIDGERPATSYRLPTSFFAVRLCGKETCVCFIIGQRVGSLSRAAFYEFIKERKGEGVEGIGLLTVIHEYIIML